MKLTPSQLRLFVRQHSSIMPEGALERIIIDKNGGLAYPLFGSSFADKDTPINLNYSNGTMNSVSRYINAVQVYVGDAEQHARDYGFGLVSFGRNGSKMNISFDFDYNSVSPYIIGVGDIPITSARRVEKFCKMIKSGHDRFEERYRCIRELAEKVR